MAKRSCGSFFASLQIPAKFQSSGWAPELQVDDGIRIDVVGEAVSQSQLHVDGQSHVLVLQQTQDRTLCDQSVGVECRRIDMRQSVHYVISVTLHYCHVDAFAVGWDDPNRCDLPERIAELPVVFDGDPDAKALSRRQHVHRVLWQERVGDGPDLLEASLVERQSRVAIVGKALDGEGDVQMLRCHMTNQPSA